ncbi:DUF2461 domain-containing protein [Chryseolinea sp. H1M3-3]|uniref:DUF2461 domain-containing protein n=1 Tax=Chryseolinea sp. H1M3-3 TaxID=3034144 RepID=UPI0023ED64A4|nr:DUF2461 domain-containing protein [Chryseolinea sp. H1M3-3]
MDFEKTFEFLRKISRNNNRDWFEKNKPRYLEIKNEFELFIGELLHKMIQFDESLAGLDPKKLVFRIYRDIRFSKDKTPYKTFISAGLSAAGKGTGIPGYYLQIEPGNKTILAVGLYLPSAENLTKIRQEIDYNGDRLTEIANEKTFKKSFGTFWAEDKLKTMPKGYPKDHPHIELLKLKSFMVIRNFKDSEVTDKKFLSKLVDSMKSAKPLNDFLTEGLS